MLLILQLIEEHQKKEKEKSTVHRLVSLETLLETPRRPGIFGPPQTPRKAPCFECLGTLVKRRAWTPWKRWQKRSMWFGL